MPDGYSFPVAAVEPGHLIVLRQCPPEHPWTAVWTFVIEPDGPDRCRLSTTPPASPKLPSAWFKHAFWRGHRMAYRLSGG